MRYVVVADERGGWTVVDTATGREPFSSASREECVAFAAEREARQAWSR